MRLSGCASILYFPCLVFGFSLDKLKDLSNTLGNTTSFSTHHIFLSELSKSSIVKKCKTYLDPLSMTDLKHDPSFSEHEV